MEDGNDENKEMKTMIEELKRKAESMIDGLLPKSLCGSNLYCKQILGCWGIG